MPELHNAEWETLGAAPPTPSTDNWKVYFKSDGLYVIDDSGTEHGPLGASGGRQGGLLYSAHEDSWFADTTDETSLFGTSGAAGSLTIPANTLQVGDVVDLHVFGMVQTKVEPVGDITLRYYLNGTARQTAVLTDGVIAGTPGVARPFEVDGRLVVQEANIYFFGKLTLYIDGTGFANEKPDIFHIDQTWTSGIDLDAPISLDLTWEWETADSQNGVELYGATIAFMPVLSL